MVSQGGKRLPAPSALSAEVRCTQLARLTVNERSLRLTEQTASEDPKWVRKPEPSGVHPRTGFGPPVSLGGDLRGGDDLGAGAARDPLNPWQLAWPATAHRGRGSNARAAAQ